MSPTTRHWPYLSPTSPSWRPKGYWIKAARGTQTRSVVSGILLIETVGIPAFLISRRSSTPDRMQSGQTGMTNTASTPSSFIFEMIFGTVCFTSGLKLGM